ncbi:MAG TPA: hypothetical protein VF556_02740 [Pyrinomonadaceae bacterium]|jgi:hypothetical protein
MKKAIFTVFLFSGLFLLSSNNAFACSCSDHFTPVIADYSRADAVFAGKVISIKKFGNEPENKAWFPKRRTVEFEIQKVYKGINSSTKRIALITNFNAASCGFDEDEAPKKGQRWIVFVHKDEEDNRLYFGGMCEPYGYLENASDLSYYETKITSVKEKQAIIGTVVDEMKIEGIKDIEVILEGAGQRITTRTDEKGLYYFPVASKGNYKITINIPFAASSGVSTFPVEENRTKENADVNAQLIKSTLTYDVQLKGR